MASRRQVEEDEMEESNEQSDQGKRRAEDSAPESNSPKKRKRRKVSNEDTFDEELGLNLAIGEMDNKMIIDYIAQRVRRVEPNLTMLQAADTYIPQAAVLDTSDWDQPRTEETLPDFLRKFAGEELALAPKENGSPHTLILAGAALRAADLTRILRVFQSKDAKVGKLFTKHIKLGEAKKFCRENRMSLAVGTPKRIHDLLSDGSLSAQHLKTIVIDASRIDQKKRGILDMPETLLQLLRLLSRKDFRRRYEASAEENRLRLLFY